MTDRLYISACALALAEIIIDCTHVLLTEGRDNGDRTADLPHVDDSVIDCKEWEVE